MYLDQIANGTAKIDEQLTKEFGKTCELMLKDRIEEDRSGPFTLRLSNIGKPLCQLQRESSGELGEASSTWFPMMMIYGNVIEALAIAILKGAGVNVSLEQDKVSLKLENGQVNGSLDIDIDGKIYDIKSCSDWSFKQKFKDKTIYELREKDDFGYVQQILSYSIAQDKDCGGIIAINKSDGEWTIVECPSRKDDPQLYQGAIDKANEVYDKINNKEPFKRCYDAVPETFYSKLTGNLILGSTCGFCRFKGKCWPDLQVIGKLPSKAKTKPMEYYVYVHQDYK